MVNSRNRAPQKQPAKTPSVLGSSLITPHDIYLYKEGNHCRLYDKLGSHVLKKKNRKGVYFAVWAPNAEDVSVIGDFNLWTAGRHQLRSRRDDSGIWEGFIPGIEKGALYKYHIVSRVNHQGRDKGDPFAFSWEKPPRTASLVWDLEYEWNDKQWMKSRRNQNALEAPFSIYEVHLGSWKQKSQDGSRFLSYREMAVELAAYVMEMGFTHVELMPVMEHPFYGSWGYQVSGYFAPTQRYGTPQDFMYLIDLLHQNGIGVILDWVPSHFPNDEFSLAFYDGTHLYEHSDPRQGFHPEWKSCIFNYGRKEVRSFLISSALFWLDKYHADGLRVDAVASMLYLDYSREEGEWIPNRFGGRENLEATSFLQKLNEQVYSSFPDVQTFAEESTAWPMVTRPVHMGGLGFGVKWNMGWMHDTLEYFKKNPIHRKYYSDFLTFGLWYIFSENFILPFSHDEVVHGKGSLLDKMPGDEWQKKANLRLLLGWMFTHPGKKLLFMGGEFGQREEWSHEKSLGWHLLENPSHQGIQLWMKDLNRFYRNESSLYSMDFKPEGFEWIDFSDKDHCVLSFLRLSRKKNEIFLIVANFTPVPREKYRIGVPAMGRWEEILNSDALNYGGSGMGNLGGVGAENIPLHGRAFSLELCLPPLGLIVFKAPLSDNSKEADVLGLNSGSKRDE